MADLRLRILLGRFQNAFFAELADLIVDEVHRAGGVADVVDHPIRPEPEDVLVVLPTHEYAALEGSTWADDPLVTRRMIGITAEQPGSQFFATNVALGARLGAVFDFSQHAVGAYRRDGVPAQHLPFGWTPSWDRFSAEPAYDRDLLFLGCVSGRREQALSQLTRPLWQREAMLVMSDNSAPNWQDVGSFVTRDIKKALLAGSRVLLNLHQSNEPYFEWLRAVEAAHCGAVILSEPSIHQEPFVSGRHLHVAPIPAMPAVLDALLDDPDRLRSLRAAAYELVRARPFARGVERLLSVAEDVRRDAPAPGGPVGPRRQNPLPHPHRPHWERERGDDDSVRQAVRELRLDMIDLRRSLARTGRTPTSLTPAVTAQTPAWAVRTGRVSMIMALYNHAPYVEEALESAASGSYGDVELVVTDDGSTDDSAAVVRDWMRRSPHVPAALVSHPVNQGLPRARNTALDHARGELIFVLDADNALVPTGLSRLVSALDADPAAAFCYGVLQRFDAAGPVGLLGMLPWEPWRLRYYNYIDAMALLRASVLRELGGYSTDRRLHGWEDYDLWCRIAEQGSHGAHVPSVVGRYRTSATSMLSLTNLSTDASFDALREHAPRLMAGALESRGDPFRDWLGEVASARTGRDAWLTEWEESRG